jgi:hypothetical protein
MMDTPYEWYRLYRYEVSVYIFSGNYVTSKKRARHLLCGWSDPDWSSGDMYRDENA